MNIIIHNPVDDKTKAELQYQVAVAHAEAVLSYISKLTCPKSQKTAIIDALIKTNNKIK